MPIDGFDFKEFAKNLADQVGPALPDDLSDTDKQYIVNIVYNFCYMAGEAIANDANLTFNSEQASIVTQFIGEWSFHKAIDVIKSGIEPQFRDGILQKIAFTVFEIAKTAIVKNMPQADMIAVVEFQVKKAYQESLDELKQNGAFTEEQYDKALHHSNIDEMAQDAAKMQAEADAHAQAGGGAHPAMGTNDNYASAVSDNKILKLATFAIVLKYLAPEKRQGLLNKFSPDDAEILRDYAEMDDLENRLDRGLVVKCLNEIKKTLPESKKINKGKIYERLYKIVKNSDISKISNIIGRERQAVKSFVSGTQDRNGGEIPPRVAEIICNHLEEKLVKK